MSDGLDCELSNGIPQFDDDTLSQPPDTEIFCNAGATNKDTVQAHSFEDDNWNPLAPLNTPQLWQLCHSIVDINQGKM